MISADNLKHHCLIAMPSLKDSGFANTVVYLCEQNEDGAMGIVLNRKMPVDFDDICAQLKIPCLDMIDPEVLAGGPVKKENGFILHKELGLWDSTLEITDDIHLTTSKDILSAIASGTGPCHYKLALGYAGWDSEQLEQELKDNSWLVLPADEALLFDTPREQLYQTALARLGVSLEFLSAQAGRA